jgi:N-acetylglutamate synthase-like GNAT family acetyltransferase
VGVRPLTEVDRSRAREWIVARWGSDVMAANGELFAPAEHDGFVAGDWEGLVTYRIDGEACEVTLIEADPRGRGTGTALLEEVCRVAREADCSSLWLVTTNDNVDGLAWYQRRGFSIVEVRAGAVDLSRRTLKPSIPTHNSENGLPITDEIELRLSLSRGPAHGSGSRMTR